MHGITPWLRKNRRIFKPNANYAARAMRHLSKQEKTRLFSADIEQMRTAEGRWYEALIYEMFLDLSLVSDEIGGIVSKGADAPRSGRNVRLGQNGFFYSRSGDITIRGNGQDLAEFDFLLMDPDGKLAFGEVVTSPSDLKEFEKEVAYKKRLLGYLFDQQVVPFLLISSFDISNYSVVKRLMRSPENINLSTISCEEIKSLLNGYRAGPPSISNGHKKRLDARDIPQKRPFFYQKYHDSERNRVFNTLSRGLGTIAQPERKEGLLVKKILYGGLYPSAIRSLCNEREIRIKGRKIEYNDIISDFSKVILATDLPDYEPLVYLRPRNKKEYLKMVQDKEGNFKFERRTPPKVGFFLWLESIGPTLGSRITTQLLAEFSR